MLKTVLNKYHYLIITAFVILLIINSIIAYYCLGVNSAILEIIFAPTLGSVGV